MRNTAVEVTFAYRPNRERVMLRRYRLCAYYTLSRRIKRHTCMGMIRSPILPTIRPFPPLANKVLGDLSACGIGFSTPCLANSHPEWLDFAKP